MNGLRAAEGPQLATVKGRQRGIGLEWAKKCVHRRGNGQGLEKERVGAQPKHSMSAVPNPLPNARLQNLVNACFDESD